MNIDRSTRQVSLPKVLLLNPPAEKVYLRDLYHVFSAKAFYTWHPSDLLTLSGALGHEFHVTVRDCIGSKMDVAELVTSLEAHKRFDFVISLTGSLTLSGDIKALKVLKQTYPQARALVIGDFVREKGEQLLREEPCIDGCLLDFTTNNLRDVLREWDDISTPQENFVIRSGDDVLNGGYKRQGPSYSIPIPHHEKFPLAEYRQPPEPSIAGRDCTGRCRVPVPVRVLCAVQR